MRSLIWCCAALWSACGAANADTVRIDSGQISGVDGYQEGIRVFKGIPYARPPVGDLRWRAPQPPAPWDGVRAADKFGAACMQTPYPEGSPYRSAAEPVSEDCLYLNVWTPAKSNRERHPVMVWIHGGAFTRGSGSTPAYDGEELAKKGVIVVTINYRLGIFGFFAHPELTKESDRNASGNYALLDQIAALEWVQRNIAAFGGDPKRVTIFGESAGSWSVNYLVASPLAKGLFQRAIGESGGAFAPMKTLAEVEKTGVEYARSLHAETLADLRAIPAEKLLNTPGSFPPNVDGWLLPHDVYTIFATGKQNDVPTIVGSNADEGKSLFPPPSGGREALERLVKARFGATADKVLAAYPAATDEEARAAYYDAMRDVTFGWQMRTWARLQTKTGKSRAYLYYFSRVPPGPGAERYGAYHAAEIAYVFDNLAELPRHAFTDVDRKLADEISSYWVNFARTGNPNGANLPKWPAYSESTDLALELGDKVAPVANLHRAALDALDDYFASQRQ